jgi:hypothetical protein
VVACRAASNEWTLKNTPPVHDLANVERPDAARPSRANANSTPVAGGGARESQAQSWRDFDCFSRNRASTFRVAETESRDQCPTQVPMASALDRRQSTSGLRERRC